MTKKPVKKSLTKKSTAKKAIVKKPTAKLRVTKKKVATLKSPEELRLANENKTLRDLVKQACEIALDGADVVASTRIVDASDDVIYRSRVDIIADNAGVQLDARPFVTVLDDDGEHVWVTETDPDNEVSASAARRADAISAMLPSGAHFFVERNGGEWHRTVDGATACVCGIDVGDERTLKIRGTDDNSYCFSPNVGFCFGDAACGTGKQRPDHGGGMAGHDEDGDYPDPSGDHPAVETPALDEDFGKSGYEDKEPQDAA